MSHPSIIGNVASLEAGEVLLPAFVQRTPDGVFVNLSSLDVGRPFYQFAERVFGAGARFDELDYEIFGNLAFLWEKEDIDRVLIELKAKGRPPLLRVARDIVPFPQERRAIYRGLKVESGGGGAEYMFEQVSVERIEEDPSAPEGKKTVVERLYPTFDEFVAALWEKGVQFGIDVAAVREAIARDKVERLAVAAAKPPTDGKDASVDEQTDLLHRDNAPRLLPNGRMDLRHYRNRFPQVAAGTRLFKKIPLVFGRSGWTVAGKELPPPEVNDFDIATLAGPGTEVVRELSGEYVLAAMDGFLDIDSDSGMISVVDKIVSREGVSMRTTGDLSLSGDDYEEHGEVQEKRNVEGHNMSFHADVFGNIISDGGCVTLKKNLSGGSVRNPNGSVFVEGSASRAQFEVLGGDVSLNQAESCLIVANRVRIVRAVNCQIVADEVEVEQSEGCLIATKNAVLKNTAARRDETTRIVLLLPDMTPFDEQCKALEAGRTNANEQVEKLAAALQAVTAQADMKAYVTMAPKIKAKAVVLSAAQQAQWDGLMARVAPHLRRATLINTEIKSLKESAAKAEGELAGVAQARKDAMLGIVCRIENVGGDTHVYAHAPVFGEPVLSGLAPKALAKRLDEIARDADRLFTGHDGSFEWQAPAE